MHQNQARHQHYRQQPQEDLAKRRGDTVNNQQPQYRYPQPPSRISPARLTPTPERQIRYADGSRCLVPTPAPGGVPSTVQYRNQHQRR